MSVIQRGVIHIALLSTVASLAAQDIRVTVNGDPVHFSGMNPMSMNGRVFVPLRGVFESMGASVDWDASTRTINALRSNREVRITIGDRYAIVDGKTMFMDAPAMIRNGYTLVPLRFVSEALGAEVEWIRNDRLVAITTTGIAYNERTREPVRSEVAIQSGTVIPVTLDQTLSSNGSRAEDRFTTTVRGNGDAYAGLPVGTKIEGRVVAARPKKGQEPGALELQFTKAVLPDGRTAVIDGSLIGLDEKSVVRNSDGVYTAREDKKDQRIVFAGYGAGAGLLVGLLTKKPLEGAVLGGLLGFLFGEIDRNNRKPADVRLENGTEFGVRLDQEMIVRSGA